MREVFAEAEGAGPHRRQGNGGESTRVMEGVSEETRPQRHLRKRLPSIPQGHQLITKTIILVI